MQEEAEAGYKEQFPDHFAMYADIADNVLQDMEPGPGLTPGQPPEASRAEAGNAVAQELVHGDLLTDVVHLHARSAAEVHYLSLTLCCQ